MKLFFSIQKLFFIIGLRYAYNELTSSFWEKKVSSPYRISISKEEGNKNKTKAKKTTINYSSKRKTL